MRPSTTAKLIQQGFIKQEKSPAPTEDEKENKLISIMKQNKE